MRRAVLKKGTIRLVEPLPRDWQEGTELVVEKAPEADDGSAGQATDQWMDEVEALAAKTTAADHDKLQAAINEVRKQAKQLARKGKR
jgi:hypothetical protein